MLAQTLRVTLSELRAKFGIARPRIGVCGLNPHAGESGYLGREEIDVIEPVIAAMKGEGTDIAGPLPADTVFVPDKARQFDCIVAMSACPQDILPINGKAGRPTEAHYEIIG